MGNGKITKKLFKFCAKCLLKKPLEFDIIQLPKGTKNIFGGNIMLNEKRTKEAVIADIIQYFKENEDIFLY